MSAVADLKTVHRGVWAAGDYARVAERIDDLPPTDLFARVDIAPGCDVLDVATGTGNVALKAAGRGAEVTGLDITPELLEVAEQRARRAGVEVTWVEGDAEDLPFGEERFDRVLSVFGVQFAPRHEVAAHELVRVCRPGGLIGLVNWTPHGQIGSLQKVVGSYMPKPPAFASSPALWGSEEHVRALFADSPVELELHHGHNPWRFKSAEHWASFLETLYGPTVKARERLTAEGGWDECRREIVALAESANEATDGSLLMHAEYLVTVARRTA